MFDDTSLLHDLNNVLVTILLNAQVVGWKLPSYSRLKRNVHEIERGAQRGAVMVSRLRAMTTAAVGENGLGRHGTGEERLNEDSNANGCQPGNRNKRIG
jgi:hypothetical protein